MGTNTVNLKSIYKTLIHIPNVKNKDSSPLYALNDDKETDDEVKNLVKSPEWIEACKNNYNSPTNVRKLYITKNHVKIEFYKPIIVGGKPTQNGLIIERSVPSDVNEIIMGRTNLYNNSMNDMAYIASKLNSLKINGSILSLLNTPWVLSNIEEVYIDTVGLYSENIRGLIGDYNLAVMEYNKNVAPLRKNIKQIVNLMLGFSINENNISQKFPRLRFVAIIPDLDKYLGLVSSQRKSIDEDGIKNVLLYKLKSIQDFDISKSAIYTTENAKRVEDGKLSIRTYYKFDKEFLKPFTDKWQQRVAESIAKKKQEEKEIRQKQIDESMLEVERKLNDIAIETSNKEAIAILRIATSWLSKQDKQELLNTFTPDGKNKFGSVLI